MRNTRQVEHEVRLGAPAVQFFRCRVYVVFKDFLDASPVMPDLIGHLESIVAGLPVPDILQLRT